MAIMVLNTVNIVVDRVIIVNNMFILAIVVINVDINIIITVIMILEIIQII